MSKILSIFSAFGVELEYMIVDCNTLDVKPIADEVLKAVAGEYVTDVERGEIAWSNELVLHLIELKTNGPKNDLTILPAFFLKNIQQINKILSGFGARLLPTGAHPWMNPDTQTKLWPHGANHIYNAYTKIFDCRGHGWSNLQSVHLNLPFAIDEEFARLHTAIRLVLPLIPAIAASTPIIDGKATGILDNRLEFYRQNQRRIPSISGKIIPELVTSAAEYQEKILQPMYADIAPLDPEKILQYEWLNSRGAIARFERNSIEIRVIDSQECVSSELAIAAIIVKILQTLVEEQWVSYDLQQQLTEDELLAIFLDTCKSGSCTLIENAVFLRVFGISRKSATAREVWEYIFDQLLSSSGSTAQQFNYFTTFYQTYLTRGNLAERIMQELSGDYSRPNLHRLYHHLAGCLAENLLL